MKKKKKKSFKNKTIKLKKKPAQKFKKKKKKLVNKKSNLKKRKKVSKKSKRKIKRKVKKITKNKSIKRSNQKTRVIVSSFLRLNDKIKLLVRFNFNLDQSLQNFFNSIANKVSVIKKVIIEEREKQKILKIKQMANEKKEAQRKIIQEGEIALKAKKLNSKKNRSLKREKIRITKVYKARAS